MATKSVMETTTLKMEAGTKGTNPTSKKKAYCLPRRLPTSSPSHSRAPSSAPSEISHLPTRPPSSASGGGGSLFLEDDGDLFDFEGVSGGGTGSSNKSSTLGNEPVKDVDENDIWAELDADPSAFDDPPPVASICRTSGLKLKPAKGADEDDEMWGILDEMDTDMDPPPNPPAISVSQPVDSNVRSDTAQETTERPTKATPSQPAVPDDDWDDMYV